MVKAGSPLAVEVAAVMGLLLERLAEQGCSARDVLYVHLFISDMKVGRTHEYENRTTKTMENKSGSGSQESEWTPFPDPRLFPPAALHDVW